MLGRLRGLPGTVRSAISARYVHPSEDAVLDAVEKLGRHKIGHSENCADGKKDRKSAIRMMQRREVGRGARI